MVLAIDERHFDRLIRQGLRGVEAAEPSADDDYSGALTSSVHRTSPGISLRLSTH
jgi:hypothetical protein